MKEVWYIKRKKMDIKEAQDIIGITEDEETSIKKYLGFSHTGINFLGDFSPEGYDVLNNKRMVDARNSERL